MSMDMLLSKKQLQQSTTVEKQCTAMPGRPLGTIPLLKNNLACIVTAFTSTYLCILKGLTASKVMLSEGYHQPTVKFITLSECEKLISSEIMCYSKQEGQKSSIYD